MQATLYIIKDAEFNSGTVGKRANNEGTISNGTFQWEVTNEGTISGGIFQRRVYNYEIISDGTFQGDVRNYGTISGGTFEEAVGVYASSRTEAKIEGGTFEKDMTLANDDAPITIKDGLFDGEVVTKKCDSPLSISGGLFTKKVDVSGINPDNLQITGGYFVSEPTVPEGSDIAFTSVSDQNGRTFQVRVNGGFSKNGYEALYVPHGMSERQANPITVKTDTALTDCLADGESIMGTDKVRKNNDGSYTIEVYQPESIVLVTEKPAPPTPDEPGDEIDRASPPAQPHLASCWALRVWVISPMLTSLPCTCTIPCRAALSPLPGRSWQTSCGRLPASPTL